MELGSLQGKITGFIKKYRYVIIVLVIGIVFMLLPEIGTDPDKSAHEEIASDEPLSEPSINERLAEILSKISGAGDVQVLLTVSAGEETVYQTDDNISITEDTNTTQVDTVVVTDADRNQTGLIRQVNPPAYLGAIVVCQGADSPAVRLAIVDAVSKVTGLGADRISVLKMK